MMSTVDTIEFLVVAFGAYAAICYGLYRIVRSTKNRWL